MRIGRVVPPWPLRSTHLRLTLFFLLTASWSCAPVRLIADYDATTYEETIRVAKRVDVFYGKVLELEAKDRLYAPFAPDYVDIGADLRSLVQRNASRALNSESRRISQIIVDFWEQYQAKHKANNAYADASLDRRRFTRLFEAALSAERAKQLASEDKQPSPF